jgi:hypothetical protein
VVGEQGVQSYPIDQEGQPEIAAVDPARWPWRPDELRPVPPDRRGDLGGGFADGVDNRAAAFLDVARGRLERFEIELIERGAPLIVTLRGWD